MSYHSDVIRETKLAGKRRGQRMNSRVPVRVEWQSPGGLVRQEAATCVVGPYGCLVVLPQALEVGHVLRVTNTITGATSEARVVWKGKQRPDGWELGIELLVPGFDFWGIEL